MASNSLNMISINEYLRGFTGIFPGSDQLAPWDFISRLQEILHAMIRNLGDDFVVRDDVAVHKTAFIDRSAIVHGPVIVDAHALIGCYAFVRNGAYIGKNSVIGSHTEFKNSIILNDSTCGHFNFVGESMIGSGVNLEAGAVLANHYNELMDKNVFVRNGNELIDTGNIKFGSVIGDGSRIGANAVVSPGVFLSPDSVIGRLQLVEVK